MPLTRPAPTDYLDTPGVELDLLLDEYADAIEAIEGVIGVTYRGVFVPSLLNRDTRYHAERSPVTYRTIRLRRTYRTTSAP